MIANLRRKVNEKMIYLRIRRCHRDSKNRAVAGPSLPPSRKMRILTGILRIFTLDFFSEIWYYIYTGFVRNTGLYVRKSPVTIYEKRGIRYETHR